MIVDTKWISGYEGLYRVDEIGNVYSEKRRTTKGGLLKQSTTDKGYKRVALTKDGKTRIYFVHRLVAEAFIANPENRPQVNHKDENKSNNRVENLEWCTASYNSNYGTGIRRNVEKRLGVPLADNRKKKISESCKGRLPSPITDESRRKMSEAAKKRWDKWRSERNV